MCELVRSMTVRFSSPLPSCGAQATLWKGLKAWLAIKRASLIRSGAVMGSSLCRAQSSDVPSVGLTVRLVTCTDARNRLAGHTRHKEISTFSHDSGFFERFERFI